MEPGRLKSGKRQFVGKRGSVRFQVMHRSLQDGAFGRTEEPSARVLHEAYDYSQHLRPIDGSGTFVTRDGRVGKVVVPAEALAAEEVAGREVESVALDPSLMDPEVRAALEAAENDALDDDQELQDDFVFQAADEGAQGDETCFDFDAHVAKLVSNCSGTVGEDFDDEDLEDEDGDVVSEEFEAALAEYDSEEEDSEEEDRIKFSDRFFAAMLEEQQQEEAEEEAAEGKARVLARVAAMEDEDDADLEREYEALAEAQRRRLEADDCQSVLSALSNLDNRPQVLFAPRGRREPAAPPPTTTTTTAATKSVLSSTKHKRDEDKALKHHRKRQAKVEKRSARDRKRATKAAWKQRPAPGGRSAPSVIALGAN
mmetsp:Transcript_16915/g.51307  ORF Transcript_16915/g.51307 Transcript_16915/m.51307 type:complete len:370 (+) Transcript_16915:82-1191(+)